MSAEQSPKFNSSLEYQFDAAAGRAIAADRLEGKRHLNTHSERDFTHIGGDYHEYLGGPQNPNMVAVSRPKRSGHIESMYAESYKSEGNQSVHAESKIRRPSNGEPVDEARLRVYRNGKSKELVSDNPFVADMIAKIAIKGARRETEARIDRLQNERRAA
jgi:hypothetical protein